MIELRRKTFNRNSSFRDLGKLASISTAKYCCIILKARVRSLLLSFVAQHGVESCPKNIIQSTQRLANANVRTL